MFRKAKILARHGRQYIKRLDKVVLPEVFRGRPELAAEADVNVIRQLAAMCPTGAISPSPYSIDLGRCIFCNECSMRAPQLVKFTNDFRMAANHRRDLIVYPGVAQIPFREDKVHKEIRGYFGRALRLREVCAGGDNSTDMELNASMNVNFDFGRYGIDFMASPRHADGIVITGPVTENMAEPLQICYDAVPEPKIIIAAGTDAISGGLFAAGRAIDRGFLQQHTPDLYVPGNPVHPLTFIDGVMKLLDIHRR